MVLLIDTAMVPARDRLDFWLESSTDSYLPVQVRSPAKEQFGARMWGYELRPAQLLPDRRGAEHDDARRRGRSRPAIPSACTCPSCCAARSRPRRRAGRASPDRRRDQLRDLAPGGVPGERAVRVARRPRAASSSAGRRTRSASAPRFGIPGSEGLPRAAVAFFRGLAGGLEDGTITADDAPNTDRVRDRPRPRPVRRALPAPMGPKRAADRAPRSCCDIQSFIEANLGDPDLDPDRHRARELHLDALPAQAVRVRGYERVPLDPAARLERCRRDLLDPARATTRSWRSRAAGACRARSTSAGSSARRTAARRATSGASARAPTTADGAAAVTPVLKATGISVSFGGVHAVVDVDLEVGEGQLVGLIGPNGAGKTTFIDAISGFVRCRRPGRARRRATSPAVPPHVRARRGLARTWQSIELFDDLSVARTSSSPRTALRVWRTIKETVSAPGNALGGDRRRSWSCSGSRRSVDAAAQRALAGPAQARRHRAGARREAAARLPRRAGRRARHARERGARRAGCAASPTTARRCCWSTTTWVSCSGSATTSSCSSSAR